ncbi:helix-turn-helix transcriptional regulator [uncultured Lactobacillus sp.]|uniref:helix-turn-helix domain-containing protein n=1 Tax=uncultured Lactobacillus sp. TaxID=153152 RepID=UPI00262A1359|nr:helix-turn-helix transcriptional regulator [uncultured Lactobacillus sp.]
MSWQKINQILKNRKISSRKLSTMSGVNYETIQNYRYKHYEPSFRNMCKIADALHVSLDELRGDKKQ